MLRQVLGEPGDCINRGYDVVPANLLCQEMTNLGKGELPAEFGSQRTSQVRVTASEFLGKIVDVLP